MEPPGSKRWWVAAECPVEVKCNIFAFLLMVSAHKYIDGT